MTVVVNRPDLFRTAGITHMFELAVKDQYVDALRSDERHEVVMARVAPFNEAHMNTLELIKLRDWLIARYPLVEYLDTSSLGLTPQQRAMIAAEQGLVQQDDRALKMFSDAMDEERPKDLVFADPVEHVASQRRVLDELADHVDEIRQNHGNQKPLVVGECGLCHCPVVQVGPFYPGGPTPLLHNPADEERKAAAISDHIRERRQWLSNKDFA